MASDGLHNLWWGGDWCANVGSECVGDDSERASGQHDDKLGHGGKWLSRTVACVPTASVAVCGGDPNEEVGRGDPCQ